ncbi:MAG: hypothetical protein CFE45_27035, partial [Burkholderiales bacterium PBB5]
MNPSHATDRAAAGTAPAASPPATQTAFQPVAASSMPHDALPLLTRRQAQRWAASLPLLALA